jgi:hypothetical protein
MKEYYLRAAFAELPVQSRLLFCRYQPAVRLCIPAKRVYLLEKQALKAVYNNISCSFKPQIIWYVIVI